MRPFGRSLLRVLGRSLRNAIERLFLGFLCLQQELDSGGNQPDFVVDLNVTNFDAVLKNTSAPFAVVEFFTHGSRCRVYTSRYGKVARLFNGVDAVHPGIILVTRVDCAYKFSETKPITEKNGLDQFNLDHPFHQFNLSPSRAIARLLSQVAKEFTTYDLKVGCPIILLRNIDPSNGLCNGTRLICKSFQMNVIGAEIAVGHHAGKRVFLPRIPLCLSADDMFPFKLKRKQFPIRLSFVMTINKAQGQTIPNLGVYLPELVFLHDQLYVALSIGISRENTKVLVKPIKEFTNEGVYTSNVVYREVLHDI
ncbi:hypothetical protein LXL04_007729 [Taraxacum kok-saghyz]